MSNIWGGLNHNRSQQSLFSRSRAEKTVRPIWFFKEYWNLGLFWGHSANKTRTRLSYLLYGLFLLLLNPIFLEYASCENLGTRIPIWEINFYSSWVRIKNKNDYSKLGLDINCCGYSTMDLKSIPTYKHLEFLFHFQLVDCGETIQASEARTNDAQKWQLHLTT